MGKRETYFQKVIFITTAIFKVLTPPVYSYERLERYCRSRINKNPEAYLPRWFLAGLYKDNQKYEEAKKEYLEIKKLGYLSDKDCLSLGEILFRLNDFQGVIDTLTPIIDKYPKNRNANWYLGISYMKGEEYQKAVTYLENVNRIRGGRYGDYWHLGFCYSNLGALEKAKENYYKALEGLSNSDELRQNLASVHIKIGQSLVDEDLDRAEAEFKAALDVHPGNPEAIRILGSVQALRKNIQQASQFKWKQN